MRNKALYWLLLAVFCFIAAASAASALFGKFDLWSYLSARRRLRIIESRVRSLEAKSAFQERRLELWQTGRISQDQLEIEALRGAKMIPNGYKAVATE